MEKDVLAPDLSPACVAVDYARFDLRAELLDGTARLIAQRLSREDDRPRTEVLYGPGHARELADRKCEICSSTIELGQDLEFPADLHAVVQCDITTDQRGEVGQRDGDRASFRVFVVDEHELFTVFALKSGRAG